MQNDMDFKRALAFHKKITEGSVWHNQDFVDAVEEALKIAHAVQSGEVSDKSAFAGIHKYEEMMGGCRLPDGEGYDEEIVSEMFKAMSAQLMKEISDEG